MGKQCILILRDGTRIKGLLNHVGEKSAIDGKPWISFDIGDNKALAQYNLHWDNIFDVKEN